MGFYQSKIVPKMINAAMGMQAISDERAQIVPLATGRVLEIGIGSGLNLPHYGPGVESVTGADPSIELAAMAQERAAAVDFPVEFRSVSGEHLPFDEPQFDTAVITWTLCSIPDPAMALGEVHRVLKPGAKLLFIEHGKSPEPKVFKWQNRVNKVWPKLAGGCNINRPVEELVLAARFAIENLDASYAKGPKVLSYFYRGIAHKA